MKVLACAAYARNDPLYVQRCRPGRFIWAIQAPAPLACFASVLQALASYLCEVSRVLLETAQYKSRSGADQWLSGVSQLREIGTRRRCSGARDARAARRRAHAVAPYRCRPGCSATSKRRIAPIRLPQVPDTGNHGRRRLATGQHAVDRVELWFHCGQGSARLGGRRPKK